MEIKLAKTANLAAAVAPRFPWRARRASTLSAFNLDYNLA